MSADVDGFQSGLMRTCLNDHGLARPKVAPLDNPQTGCSNALETGDPVVAIGFAKETNTFRQGPRQTAPRSLTASTTPRTRLFAVVHAAG
jgi:hypothetical protein